MTNNMLWMKGSADFHVPILPTMLAHRGRAAPFLCCVFWPNGRVCWEINAYIISLIKRGRRPASVNTYASELSVFVRFVSTQGGEFSQLTDDNIYAFSAWLGGVREGVISGNHINRLIARALSFLWWLQYKIPCEPLVGIDGSGAKILVELTSAKRIRASFGMHHGSMVAKSIPRLVRPMLYEHLNSIVDASSSAFSRNFAVNRNRLIVSTLADSGIRREELTYLMVRDLNCRDDGSWSLIVRTSKRNGHPSRQVPIPTPTARAIQDFIKVHRAIHWRKLKKSDIDDGGWLFCSVYGCRLAPVAVTQIFAEMKRSAGIKGRATPHMLRHRWITLQLLERLKQFNGFSPWTVEMLSTILSGLASITGHGSIESLWTYVDWSFEELKQEFLEKNRQIDKQRLIDEMRSIEQKIKLSGDSELVNALGRLFKLIPLSNMQPNFPVRSIIGKKSPPEGQTR